MMTHMMSGFVYDERYRTAIFVDSSTMPNWMGTIVKRKRRRSMSMLFMYSENGRIFYSFLSFGYLFQKVVV